MGKQGRDSVTIGGGCTCAGTASGRPVGQLGSRVMPGSKALRLQFSGRSVISLSNSSVGKKDRLFLYFIFDDSLPGWAVALLHLTR